MISEPLEYCDICGGVIAQRDDSIRECLRCRSVINPRGDVDG